MEKELFNDYQRHFVDLLYNTITRMSTNSANCKIWLMGLLTLLTTLIQIDRLPVITLSVALLLVIVFYLLDSYYLYLEKNFRQMQQYFTQTIIKDCKDTKWLYNFNYKLYLDKNGDRLIKHNYRRALGSFSTWPFYSAMAVIIICESTLKHFVQ